MIGAILGGAGSIIGGIDSLFNGNKRAREASKQAMAIANANNKASEVALQTAQLNAQTEQTGIMAKMKANKLYIAIAGGVAVLITVVLVLTKKKRR